jgi:hypothetical protein
MDQMNRLQNRRPGELKTEISNEQGHGIEGTQRKRRST